MAECNRCGACCWPIETSWTKREIAQRNTPLGDKEFVAKHWRRIRQDVALQRIKERYADADSLVWDGVRKALKGGRYYECDQYDPGTKTCGAHDTKPPICRSFPWYNEPPVPHRLYCLPNCSFEADLCVNATE